MQFLKLHVSVVESKDLYRFVFFFLVKFVKICPFEKLWKQTIEKTTVMETATSEYKSSTTDEKAALSANMLMLTANVC